MSGGEQLNPHFRLPTRPFDKARSARMIEEIKSGPMKVPCEDCGGEIETGTGRWCLGCCLTRLTENPTQRVTRERLKGLPIFYPEDEQR